MNINKLKNEKNFIVIINRSIQLAQNGVFEVWMVKEYKLMIIFKNNFEPCFFE